jgi:hypothetical protein
MIVMLIKVGIQGISALLMNRFTEANEVAVSSGVSRVTAGTKGTPREQATPKAYQDEDTKQLYIPGPMIFANIIAAGAFHKYGKSKVTTQKTSLVPAGLCVTDIVCGLVWKGSPVTDFEVDSRSVVIPSTGGRVMCYRPRVDEWETSFTLEVNKDMFDAKFVRFLLDDGGSKLGLGDYRPARKGPFGRYVVVSWDVK